MSFIDEVLKNMKKPFILLLFISIFLVFGCAPKGQSVTVDVVETSYYVQFEQVAYEKALDDGKIVLLDFYANWCPICRAENPQLREGLNELNNERVIAFQVHYNDNEVTPEEEALAKEFGVTYQHTKVILKNKEVVLKSLESWSKEKTIAEIERVL